MNIEIDGGSYPLYKTSYIWGAMLPVVRKSAIANMNVQQQGQVKLQGLFGESVSSLEMSGN
jgi:hypothetical protein